MIGTPRGLALALLLAAGTTGCISDLGVPFQRNSGHVALLYADTGTDYEFISNHTTYGIEWNENEEGTHGWGYEGSIRFGSGEGGGLEFERNPTAVPPAVVYEEVHKQRKSDFRDISFGVRQTFWPDFPIQPYFGVGGTFQRVRNVDRFEFTNLTPPNDPPTVPGKETFQGNGPALYAHTGLQWNLLNDALGRDTEFVLAIDVRGVLGDEYDTLELGFTLGFGK